MRMLLSLLLASLSFVNPVAMHPDLPSGQPAAAPAADRAGATHASPARAAVPVTSGDAAEPDVPVVVLDDGFDFLVLLSDPAIATEIVGVVEWTDRTLVACVHSFVRRPQRVQSWPVIYVIPPTIFAHSAIQVPFHAEEMK